MNDPLFGSNLAQKFAVERVSTLLSGLSEDILIAVSEVIRARAGPIHPTRPHDAIALVMQLRPFVGRVSVAGREVFSGRLNTGALSVVSLKREISVQSSGPCHMVVVYLTQYTLERICPIDLIDRTRNSGPDIFTIRQEAVAHGLVKSLLPSLAEPHRASDPFVENILRALVLYCVRTRASVGSVDDLIISVPSMNEEVDLPDIYFD